MQLVPHSQTLGMQAPISSRDGIKVSFKNKIPNDE